MYLFSEIVITEDLGKVLDAVARGDVINPVTLETISMVTLENVQMSVEELIKGAIKAKLILETSKNKYAITDLGEKFKRYAKRVSWTEILVIRTQSLL